MFINELRETLETYSYVCPSSQDLIKYKNNDIDINDVARNFIELHLKKCNICLDKFKKIDMSNINSHNFESKYEKNMLQAAGRVNVGEIWYIKPCRNKENLSHYSDFVVTKQKDNNIFEVAPISFDIFFGGDNQIFIPANSIKNPFLENYIIMKNEKITVPLANFIEKIGEINEFELKFIDNDDPTVEYISLGIDEKLLFIDGFPVTNERQINNIFKTYDNNETVITTSIVNIKKYIKEIEYYHLQRCYLNLNYLPDTVAVGANATEKITNDCNIIKNLFDNIQIAVLNWHDYMKTIPTIFNLENLLSQERCIVRMADIDKKLSGEIIIELGEFLLGNKDKYDIVIKVNENEFVKCGTCYLISKNRNYYYYIILDKNNQIKLVDNKNKLNLKLSFVLGNDCQNFSEIDLNENDYVVSENKKTMVINISKYIRNDQYHQLASNVDKKEIYPLLLIKL